MGGFGQAAERLKDQTPDHQERQAKPCQQAGQRHHDAPPEPPVGLDGDGVDRRGDDHEQAPRQLSRDRQGDVPAVEIAPDRALLSLRRPLVPERSHGSTAIRHQGIRHHHASGVDNPDQVSRGCGQAETPGEFLEATYETVERQGRRDDDRFYVAASHGIDSGKAQRNRCDETRHGTSHHRLPDNEAIRRQSIPEIRSVGQVDAQPLSGRSAADGAIARDGEYRGDEGMIVGATPDPTWTVSAGAILPSR